jgi:hypothetical protein
MTCRVYGVFVALGMGLLSSVGVACGDDTVPPVGGGGAGAAGGNGAGGNGAGTDGGGGDGPNDGGGGGDGGGGDRPDQACDHPPSDPVSAPKCDPGDLDVAGVIDDVAVDIDSVGGFGMSMYSTFREIGSHGLVYFPETEGEPGVSKPTRAIVRFPDESALADSWYCAGKGSDLTMDPQGLAFDFTLDSLSLLGSCETAAPVEGEIAACFTFEATGCENHNAVSTVPGAAFDLLFAGGYDTLSAGEATTFALFQGPDFQATNSIVGALAVDKFAVDTAVIDEVQTAPLGRGYLVVPPGAPDEGAVYCFGEGSTAEYLLTADSDDALFVQVRRADLKGLKRIGACPAEDACASGQLKGCTR